MTNYTTFSDSELTEALNFHRRQRNMSRGINEAAHARQTLMVRMLEAEEARRLNEEKPNKYVIYKHKDKYGVSQDIGTGYNWDHSYHHGYHDTVDAAKAWAAKHAGKYPHNVTVKEEVELDEQIKGWKHAASDISKMRAAQGKNVKLVSLKKDGTESKMNDATKMFRSEDEAQEHHDRVTKLNPKSKIRHNLYVDGKHVKTLGEEVELDEESTKIDIPKSRYETMRKMHGAKGLAKTPKGEMQYKGAEHFAYDKSTNTHITHTYSHPDHGLATIEKRTHKPTGKTTYYLYKKKVNEEVDLDEEFGDYSSKKTSEKKSTTAHPDGKPVHHILHKGEVVGTIEPYSAYREKRKPGSRIVSSRTNVTKYSVHFHAGKGPTKSADMPLYHKLDHPNVQSALKSAAEVHSNWLKKSALKEEVDQIDEISKSTLGSYATKAMNHADIAARMSHSDSDEMGKIANKRTTGVKKAVDRLAGKKTAASIKSNIDKAREAARNRGTDKGDHGKAYYAAQKGISKIREEAEQIDEISKDTLHSYWKKAAIARAPLDAKARKADTQKINRIRSGKPLTGYKPKDELTPDEKRVRTNRSKGMDRAARTLFRSEEVEINEASLLGPEGAIHKQASADQSDREYLKQMAFKNAWKAKNPGKTWPGYEKAGFKEEVEHIEEASDLRITKIYNKWPKKATYAVHNANRSYFKEFDSIEAAKAHHDEKTNNK